MHGTYTLSSQALSSSSETVRVVSYKTFGIPTSFLPHPATIPSTPFILSDGTNSARNGKKQTGLIYWQNIVKCSMEKQISYYHNPSPSPKSNFKGLGLGVTIITPTHMQQS